MRELTIVSELLLVLYVATVLVNCCYYLYFLKFGFARDVLNKNVSSSKEGVSIVICAKNEAQNIEALLQSLLSQDYPLFEILLVNDNSTDATPALIYHFANLHDAIKVIDLNPKTGKKAGITQAIANSSYKKLLFTDADCLPNSPHWITSMTQKLNGPKEIVLGYSGYKHYKNSWLNKLIRFETLVTAMQYFSYATYNNTYMGVGRNLSYLKKTFKAANGFKKHLHLKAGDDDLFVNQTATTTNVTMCFNAESFTYSEPKRTWKEWFVQKRRHTDVARKYKLKHQIQLGLFYLSQFLFFGLLTVLLVQQQFILLVCVLALIRIFLVWFVTSKTAIKLEERKLIPVIPILEPFLISLQLLIFISNTLVKPRRWN
ncbi:glycosyltransferase [Leeuwenhoekiella sp. NPDC079379]|uniref:glycosyltransferase n=1 Tax=Leeuwenhoekiella sp. NPDC079379 TaxID=3364122 RepID=UPI0037C93D82